MTKENYIADPATTKLLSEDEIELKLRELALDKRELELKQSQLDFSQGKKVSPVAASIILGLVAAIVAMLGNWYQGKVNTDLERQRITSASELEQKKFESALILKAVEPKDKNDQLQNLQFLVKIGLIKDTDNKIMSIQSTDLPTLSSSFPQVTPPILEDAWGIALETDFSINDARSHLLSMAVANGFNNSYIFGRPEGFRTVVVFKTEKEANEQIPNTRKINPTVSEPKKLDEWCPNRQWNQEQQYFECGL